MSKTDGSYNQRSFPKKLLITNELCPCRFTVNSTCPMFMKTWSYNLVDCDSCDGCVHWKCIKDFYEKHSKAKDFYNKTFICYYCIDRININLESYHMSFGLSKPLRLIESINWFFSFLKIYFVRDNTNLFKKTFQFKHIDSRVSDVRKHFAS